MVEDCALLSWTLGDVLELAGFASVVATSGEQAKRELTVRRFAALLLDFRLPDMLGLDVYREAQRLDPDLPVLLLSGYEPEHMIQQLLPDATTKRLRVPCDVRRAVQELAGVPPGGALFVETLAPPQIFATGLVAALEAVDVPVHRLRVAHELAALELAPREVVVLELNAPLLGHLETLLDLHAREPTCRAVLALSADRRAQGFCMKPVDPELLLALLESLPRG